MFCNTIQIFSTNDIKSSIYSCVLTLSKSAYKTFDFQYTYWKNRNKELLVSIHVNSNKELTLVIVIFNSSFLVDTNGIIYKTT